MGVFVEESSLSRADARYTGKIVMAEAATTAIALLRQSCMRKLSLEFSVLHHE
jgi:hypothetical protein